MDWLKQYWAQVTVIVGLLTGGGAWVATADSYHQKTMKNADVSTRAVEAVEKLTYANEVQNLTIRLLCQQEEHKAEAICRAIAAQDQARAAKARAEAAAQPAPEAPTEEP